MLIKYEFFLNGMVYWFSLDSALGVFKQPDWHVNFNRGLIWDLIWAFFWAIWDLIWQKFCGCDLIWDLIWLSLLAGGLIWDLIWWTFEQPDLICGLIWQVFWHCDLIWGLIWKFFKPLIWFEVWFDFQKAGLPIPSACAADRRSCYAMVPRQLLRIASSIWICFWCNTGASL